MMSMKTLDDYLKSPNWKQDASWAMRVFHALLTHVADRHADGKYLFELSPAHVVLSDTFDADNELHLLPACENMEDQLLFYAAPEATPKHADERTDIFAVTAVFYTLLTGKAPWSNSCEHVNGSRQRQILLKYQRQSHQPDLTSVPSALHSIVLKGLAYDPAQRYASPDELLQDINSIDLSQPTEPEKPETPKKAEKQVLTTEANTHPRENGHFTFRKGNGNGFKDIAGMEDLKAMLLDDVLFVLRNREQAQRYRLSPPNGMLLYGPPGCGKTYLAEKFAEEAGTSFIVVQASDLGSQYIHGTQEKIAQLFRQAKSHAPVVVCLDEFDAMAPDRSSRAGEQAANEVNEFLTQLNNCSQEGIFVIALTNRPDKLDPALLRSGRFDKKIYVPLPDKQARREIFSIHLQGRPYDAEQLDLDKLSSLSDGYVGSDIAMIVSDAARKAARSNQMITEDLLEASLHANPPSVKSDTLKYYSQIRLQMEQGRDARPMIGFR